MVQERVPEAPGEAFVEDDAVALYEHAPCGHLSTTPDGRIVRVNETFLAWTGYDRAELAGRHFVDLLSAGGRLYHETHYRPLLQLQGSVREIALEVVRRDGSRMPALVNAVLDRDTAGDPRVVRIAVFDSTERREYERELLRAKERAEVSEQRARSLARTLQGTFIPPSVPTVSGLEVSGAYRPAGDGTVVGGDFYDVFAVTNDEWVVVLGDVCGKGAEAAVVTAFVRHTLRVLTVAERSPAQVLGQLNELLLLNGDEDRFCTCVLVRLSREEAGWRAVLSVGGHPPPVLIGPGREPRFAAFSGPLIGMLPDLPFAEQELLLGPEEGIVLYTDGITDGRAGGTMFGEQRLLASLRDSLAASDTIDGALSHLVSEALAFQDGNAYDDIAAVGVRVPPAH